MSLVREERHDPAAELEGLYAQRYTAFLRTALALLGDRERARDAVQEAFARALRALPGFRGDVPLEAWVFTILTNHCRDLRRADLQFTVDRPAEAVANDHPGEHAELRAAVAMLPERQRLVLFLRHYADLDYESIGATLGIERGTVAATLHAAHTRLRQMLKETTR